MSTKEEILYFPDRQNRGPLSLVLAGKSVCDGSYQIRRIFQDLTVLEYVESGTGTLTVGDETVHPGAGDVYVVPPWKPHNYYSSAQSPWIKYWFNLSGVLPETLFRAYGISDRILFRNARKAGELIRSGVSVLQRLPKDKCQPFMEMRLLQIVHSLAEDCSRHQEDRISEKTRAIRNFLDSHITKPMPDLEAISRVAGLSPAQTIRVFRRDMGTTPYHYLLERKMQAAGDILRSSAIRISDLSRSLGFHDELYFSRLFRKFHGVSPHDCRTAEANGNPLADKMI